jgi:hypothetical protein
MAAHPAPTRPGWANAMILPGGYADVGFIDAAGRQACPGWPEAGGDPSPPAGTQLAAWHAPAAGNLPGCGAWTATALTAGGQVIKLACGSIPARVECPFFRHKDGYIPSGGDYMRIRDGIRQVAGWGDLQVIEQFADLSLMEPDPGGPVFVATPARRGADQVCGHCCTASRAGPAPCPQGGRTRTGEEPHPSPRGTPRT